MQMRGVCYNHLAMNKAIIAALAFCIVSTAACAAVAPYAATSTVPVVEFKVDTAKLPHKERWGANKEVWKELSGKDRAPLDAEWKKKLGVKPWRDEARRR